VGAAVGTDGEAAELADVVLALADVGVGVAEAVAAEWAVDWGPVEAAGPTVGVAAKAVEGAEATAGWPADEHPAASPNTLTRMNMCTNLKTLPRYS
jgi:hypothetical protein